MYLIAHDLSRRSSLSNNGIVPGAIRPIKAPAAHELVLEQIRTAIALGRYRPGDALPRERDLAEMLHVSRATVREAIAVLAGEGAIRIKRGRRGGLMVQDVPVDEAAVRQNLRSNRQQLEKIFEYRTAVESAGAGLAAKRRTKADCTTIARTLGRMETLIAAGPRDDPSVVAHFQALDHDFHLQIAAASKNPWFVEATATSRIEMFRPVGGVFRRIEEQANELHAQILDAVVAQDAPQASEWMARHVEHTHTLIDSWLSLCGVSRSRQ